MREYESKEALIAEIEKKAALFIGEFSAISEQDKDLLLDGVDRSPAQMIAYQLGWLKLVQGWERDEQAGRLVITPHPDFKWNQLGGLYQAFDEEVVDFSLPDLIVQFQEQVCAMVQQVNRYTNEELFCPNQRKWASSTPSKWPVWKWIHINTVAPFTSFRTKIRKWKKVHATR
ncbi:ClbS/DfsB family four-helix bundle protein [Streptococcus cuniculi]|uniref:ClbS/DfsB family four-helix bundle protein n=1 Tax=Streptococcus cuniculi TaxID=1432788 RepID=A0A4Y9J8H3_9STRE|nr:ClbS/DfsB family four-helix bundle protein [Streptococcus cuniculi]MBF0778931.1 ClbS/DfsB family four-helix bundle protein [Streptococcus cuniculi]TFU97087.1 ClbS/DfsB family four-helix bundle protein [Streptococcus cuniculi]